ncbi:MAG: FMN-binding negative transcriptional regulator [Gammaproteobacteria bacterium]|nr:FMN-binding negative transcriptional regulator [Gammaproteobacteria bacterium]
MYIPKNMAIEDDNVIEDFINEFGFGLLVSPELEATHLPLVFKRSFQGKGYLYGHFAKANPQWKELAGTRVLVVFNGPHAYISPTWYESKPAVPTWNYASVHCYGKVELLNDFETAKSMDELVSKYEPILHKRQDIMPSDYKQKLAQGVVGFKILLDDIQAKEKLGQHRKTADQSGVYSGLNKSAHLDAKSLARYMQKRKVGTGLLR